MPTQTDKPIILAPMAGMTDAAFRSLCIRYGADLTFSEMVSAKGLSYGSERTAALLERAPNEERIAVQIFGREPDTMAREAHHIEELLGDGLASIDINMGCPARKVVRKGDGSALMREPELAAAIVRTVKDAIAVPLSVKFRRGYGIGEDICVDFAQRLEEAGADALTLHPRFAMEHYKGQADWGRIAAVKEAVSVPVIGNGDVSDGTDALALLGETGCDAVMIGRAALGRPWVFQEVKEALRGKAFREMGTAESMEVAKDHARALASLSDKALLKMRKHGSHYVAGLPGASVARRELSRCSTLDDFVTVFDGLAKEADTHAP